MLKIKNYNSEAVSTDYLNRLVDLERMDFLDNYNVTIMILPSDEKDFKLLNRGKLKDGYDAVCEVVLEDWVSSLSKPDTKPSYNIFIDVSNDINFITVGLKFLHELFHIETAKINNGEFKYVMFSEYYSNREAYKVISKMIYDLTDELEEDYKPDLYNEVDFQINRCIEKFNSYGTSETREYYEFIGYFLGNLAGMRDKDIEDIFEKINNKYLVQYLSITLKKLNSTLNTDVSDIDIDEIDLLNRIFP